MNALLLAFTLYFGPPTAGDTVIVVDDEIFAVVDDYRKLEIVRIGMHRTQDPVCEYLRPYYDRHKKDR